MVRSAVEAEAGERVAIAGDLLSGPDRTAGVGGWPTSRRIAENDPVIFDFAPRINGYWADSCNTFTVGGGAPKIQRLRRLVLTALQAGIETAVPGASVADIDRSVRKVLREHGYDYPHHTGHSIGTSVHEFPRIIPGEPARLEPGMVILLEPGAYESGTGGVRLETMLHITDSGSVQLTDHLAGTFAVT
ncbi:M24 family metallopeptidase [Micromonospora sp. DT81.3]|uniref:M24 family metallopeptidase n=1 Tax=Micromonospora sp. DT81.3 TaxID=3416523 RepID=UPI003CEEE1EA